MNVAKAATDWMREYVQAAIQTWNRFWFCPRDVRILGILRVLVGTMIVYSHIVWTIDFDAFFLRDGAIPLNYGSLLNDEAVYFWSHFYWFDSPATLYTIHALALIIFSFFTIGLFTRVSGILSFLFVVSYVNRATGALFGLDQILGFLTLYVAIGPGGSAFSIDRLIRAKRKPLNPSANTSVMANVSIRLIQIHMCVVYLFAGLSKLQGESWWRGDAIWGAMASYEYQTIDMTWMVDYLWMINLMTLTSLAFEVSYAFMIWHRWARPIYLTLAILLHLGIGVCMGMMTFGLIMIIGNIAFISPRCIEICGNVFRKRSSSTAAGQGA